MFEAPVPPQDELDNPTSAPRSHHSALSYFLSCGLIAGLCVVTFHFGVAQNLTSMLTQVADNLTSAM